MGASSSVGLLQYRTKGQALCARLAEFAAELGPGTKLPTVLQLCKEMGVSVTTLNTALGELESQKVISRRHGVGIFVSEHLQKKCVGLVCDPAFFRAGTSPFWQEIIEEMRERAATTGDGFRFYLAIPSGRADVPVHDDLIEDVQARRLNGVLFVGNNEAAVDWLKNNGVPAAVFAGKGEWMVGIDYEVIVRQGVEALLKQGCRDMALLVPWEVGVEPPEEPLYSTHAQAFQEALRDNGLPFSSERVWEACARADRNSQIPETRQEQGYQAAMAMFAGHAKMPDGLIITDDMMARGALVALQKLGLRLGEDVKVASHINRGSAVLQGFDDEVLMLEICPTDIVRAMFEMLKDLMDGQTPPQPTKWVTPRLLIGGQKNS